MIRELVRVGASRQHLRHRQAPCQPLGGRLPNSSSFSGRTRLVSPRSCGSQACSCFHRARAGQTISWRGGGSGFGPGRWDEALPLFQAAGVRLCRSLGTVASGPARPRGPASPRELHPGASSSRCRQGRPAPPGGQAQGVGSGLPGNVHWVRRTPAGGPPPARAWGGSRVGAGAAPAPSPRLRQGSCPSLHPASQALRRGSQPASPSRRQLTPCDLRAPSPSPRGPCRPPPSRPSV